uniref:Envelope polyprotein n=1 Tax=Vombatus ursinus TaxID=29139 RepID=A0A4X2KM15_VOMUR
MESRGGVGSKAPALQNLILSLLLFAYKEYPAVCNPYRPTPHRWILSRTNDGTIIQTLTCYGPPTFRFDLCALLGSGWNRDRHLQDPVTGGGGHCPTIPIPATQHGAGQGEYNIRGIQFYACPATGSPSCRGDGSFHCAEWGCETVADWIPGGGKDPLITLERQSPLPYSCWPGKCNPMILTVKQYTDDSWNLGHSWGLRLYMTGWDNGVLFTIQKVALPVQPLPIGPNPVLNPRAKIDLIPSAEPSATPGSATLKTPGAPGASILDTLTAVHAFLNSSDPNVTTACWLCLNPAPPYFVGVALELNSSFLGNLSMQNPSSTAIPARCNPNRPKLTLDDVQGTGTCLLGPDYPLRASPFNSTCTSVILVTPSSNRPGFLITTPPETWFACTLGLTTCIQDRHFLSPTEICVIVRVFPQVYVYSEEGATEHFGLPRSRRAAPILVPLLVGLGVAGSAAVGATALVQGKADYAALSTQVDKDLRALEVLVSHLETSLDSLAEVVLQNRRALDLLFLKQGGLCMALGETCCFYTNRSGVIRESLQALRQRLDDRDRARARSSSWYQDLYNWSPWLTTLLSAIMGPLVLLLLGLLVAPCIMNCLSRYIQQRIQSLKLFVLRKSYTPPDLEELAPLDSVESSV